MDLTVRIYGGGGGASDSEKEEGKAKQKKWTGNRKEGRRGRHGKAYVWTVAFAFFPFFMKEQESPTIFGRSFSAWCQDFCCPPPPPCSPSVLCGE